MTIKTWAERLEHIPDGEITTSAHIQSAMLEEIEELRTQLAAIDAAEPVVYQAKSSPGFISCSPYTWEDCTPEQFTEYQGVIETRKLFTRPMPAQDVTELVEALEEYGRAGVGNSTDWRVQLSALRLATAALSKYKGAK